MKQILCNSGGALVARMPRPTITPGHVIIRVEYSLISTGTEIAALQSSSPISAETTGIGKAKACASLAAKYLGLAVRHPDRAVVRSFEILASRTARFLPKRADSPVAISTVDDLTWSRCGAKDFESTGGKIKIETDDSEFGYQAMSGEIRVRDGLVPVFEIKGNVLKGTVSIGLLDEAKNNWLGSRIYDEGPFKDLLIFDPFSSAKVTLVIANAGSEGVSKLELDEVKGYQSPPIQNGLPLSELEDQGWNVGYSAAGKVIAVGEGITDIVPGDLVACGGAGLANHAEYVSVPRNLVCPIPDGCSVAEAATTTVGTIAMQGVRRAGPQLGETVCVLGLGLIGQITVQLLAAAGCRVLGFDLDQHRVDRALSLGLDAGSSIPDKFESICQDWTRGKGADRTIITAASKSNAVINHAMTVTRAKGTVVIVGDVGLDVERPQFYRKEIDLLMSTSYGPGRYDNSYEKEGQDYPFSYVRWTLNRNMQSYLDLIAGKRLQISSLIDRTVSVEQSPQAYEVLAKGSERPPLAVLIHYPEEIDDDTQPFDGKSIRIQGHRPAPVGPCHYALVGAGAFGTCMLVPIMNKQKDRFFLKAVVSRDSTRGGNFARLNQVETLSTDLSTVLSDSSIELVVISTRHHEHAKQVVESLQAGKHVFVEKPLALTWEELDTIVSTYRGLESPPLLMVGFNRRFSPAVQAIQKILAERHTPLMINYRLNGGYVPPESWIQDSQGGGRNIGEACHMYDIFRCLAAAPVTGITAASIAPGDKPYFRNDNFCATLTYADGSVGNLFYTAIGPKHGLPKERIEIFCNGEAYIVDDFKKAYRASDGNVLWQNNDVDKGHLEELSCFGDAIAENNLSPIPFEELVETTAVSLHVEDLIFGRIEGETPCVKG